MTTELITVEEHEILDTVVSHFKLHKFNHMPVVDKQNQLVGIISKTDIERMKMSASIFKSSTEEEYNQALFESKIAKHVMTKNVSHVSPDDSIEKAYRIFCENNIHALPVLDNGNLCGIISPLDIMHYFFSKQ